MEDGRLNIEDGRWKIEYLILKLKDERLEV